MQKSHWHKAIWIYLAVYGAVNLLFLTQFPMMHSDESWLSGLSRAMLEGGLTQTEPFFDLLKAYPNTMSVIFNAIQMAFIGAFGYGLFSVRLISLIFGVLTLVSFYRLIRLLSGSEKKAVAASVIVSLDVQFITASHLARQDIIIAFGVVLVVYWMFRHAQAWTRRHDIVTGCLAGLMLGVHPNGVMVAACAGALYVYFISVRQLKAKNLLRYVLLVAGFAGIYIGTSYLMDHSFLRHYLSYGSTLGTGASLSEKLGALPYYFEKLYFGVSGTYYIPPMRIQLLIFAGAFIASVVYGFFRREMFRFAVPVAAVLGAAVLIGRYSQPAIIVVFPVCYLMVFALIDRLPIKATAAAGIVLGAALLTQSALAIIPGRNSDYDEYLGRIEATVPAGSKTLANLNTEYAFNNGMLLDYRNLAYLDGLSFEDYIQSRQIHYIIYPQEMDYIYEYRPVWNILYGNVYPYYEQMQRFFKTSCVLMDEFTSPYAMRISGLSYTENWTVRIYMVKESD